MKRESLKARGTGRIAVAAVRTKMSRNAAVAATQLSVPMIRWARRIVRHGTPELVLAVEEGSVALYVAARVSHLSPQKQRDFVGRQRENCDGVLLTLRYG